ncbi:hypothetical protein [Variovorax sp. Varisp36]|jgi:tetratricopeptide (TPR) repeat protein|uniref:hypothetical protein n=1 Tax=Variovorax sp. Varisp36 TaxID=3243031 RepID=UPI0039A4F616
MPTSDSDSFDALMAVAMAASRADEANRAIEGFQRASAVQPNAALPQFMLGAEFAALGDMSQAETAFANATRLAPDFPMARYQLGLLQFSSGRAAVALLTWQPLLELPQTDPLPHFIQGFAALAQDQFDEALAHYEHGLTLNTTNAALSGDIQKVIDGIRSLKHSTVPSDSAADVPEDSSAHILLANYQQQGHAH